MVAFTFAEEVEFETAKSLMKIRQRVLFAVSNSLIDRKTCQRLKH